MTNRDKYGEISKIQDWFRKTAAKRDLWQEYLAYCKANKITYAQNNETLNTWWNMEEVTK